MGIQWTSKWQEHERFGVSCDTDTDAIGCDMQADCSILSYLSGKRGTAWLECHGACGAWGTSCGPWRNHQCVHGRQTHLVFDKSISIIASNDCRRWKVPRGSATQALEKRSCLAVQQHIVNWYVEHILCWSLKTILDLLQSWDDWEQRCNQQIR